MSFMFAGCLAGKNIHSNNLKSLCHGWPPLGDSSARRNPCQKIRLNKSEVFFFISILAGFLGQIHTMMDCIPLCFSRQNSWLWHMRWLVQGRPKRETKGCNKKWESFHGPILGGRGRKRVISPVGSSGVEKFCYYLHGETYPNENLNGEQRKSKNLLFFWWVEWPVTTTHSTHQNEKKLLWLLMKKGGLETWSFKTKRRPFCCCLSALLRFVICRAPRTEFYVFRVLGVKDWWTISKSVPWLTAVETLLDSKKSMSG